ncbi:MAG: glycosyltransferase family 2 protein [Oscillospiraceae bacterium]|nr:glycosyltransferase family 2 protein [Oscillospiraceae bacterium]
MTLYVIAFILSIPMRLLGLWFLATSLFFLKKTPPYPRAEPRTRFACLIPARNEEAVIAGSVGSLLAQNYPSELFDVYVVLNNCNDGTEAAALAAGAKLLRCTGPVANKGDALRQATDRLLPLCNDAFCVFDADNVAAPDFLARMNDAFLAGARVAKASMRCKNPADTWVSGCYALYYGLFDTFFNPSRAALGLSAKLVGTGFAVSSAFLEQLGGWRTGTITEDVEFAAICAEAGERIFFVPEAVAFDEAPERFGVSLIQRKRWCSGIVDTGAARLSRLLRSLPEGRRLMKIDECCLLLSPFAQTLSLFSALAALTLPARILLPGLAASLTGTTLLAGLIARRYGVGAKSVLLFPVFMATWLPLHIASLFRRTDVWREIRHGGAAVRRAEEK